MKKLIYLISTLLLFNCKNEYKLTLEKYLKEDLHFKQARIDYQLEEINLIDREYSYRRKIKYTKGTSRYDSLTNYCLKFEKKTLQLNNLDSINFYGKKLKIF